MGKKLAAKRLFHFPAGRVADGSFMAQRSNTSQMFVSTFIIIIFLFPL
jgi:hypothetical protein